MTFISKVVKSVRLLEATKSRLMTVTRPLSSEEGRTKVLVGGGTGFVGAEVCSLLRRKGYNVVIVSRSPKHGMTYNDLENKGLPQNTRAVVNLAGQNILDPLSWWTQEFKQKVYDSRIGTAKAFRNAIVQSDQKPDVFVQVTAVGYYPPSPTTEYDENWKPGNEGDKDFFSKIVIDWEDAAMLPKDIGVRNVMVRPGVVLGRNGGMIANIFWPFFLGTGGPMGSGKQPLPWIHVKDLAGLIVHSVEKDNVEGVLNGVAPQIVTNREFTDAFGSALHKPAVLPMPEAALNMAFGQERATIITKGQKVWPTRTLATGYNFRYPSIIEACQEFSSLCYKDPDEN